MFKRLGTKENEMLIFGGVYANLHALTAFKEESEKLGIDPGNIICTGDIVGCGAQPDKCIQLIKKWGIHSIGGNVEFLLKEGAADCGCESATEEGKECNIMCQNWLPFIKNKLNKTSQSYINDLPEFIKFTYGGKKYIIMHGSFFNTAEYIFKSTPWEVKQKSFDASGGEVVIAGHSGIPFIESKSQKTWVNAGSIGMPANDGNSDTWYVHLKDSQFLFKKLNYAVDEAQLAMAKAGLPTEYSDTLSTGLWHNTDALPMHEKRAQGRTIFL